MGENGGHAANLIVWVNASVAITWPDDWNVPSCLLCWPPGELRGIVGELGMKRAILTPRRFEAQTKSCFPLRARLSRSALGAWYRTSVSVLAPVVTRPVVKVAAVVEDLRETQQICRKGKRWVEKWGKAKAPAKDKMVGRDLLGISCKQV